MTRSSCPSSRSRRADVGGPPVLPHDRAPRGAQGLAVPEHDRLALVGDPDALDLGGVDLGQRGPGGLEGGLPDLLRAVLDPAGLREVLRELLVALGGDAALGGDDDRGDAGRPGVDGEDAHEAPSAAAPDDVEDPLVDPGQVGVDAHLVVLGADPLVERGVTLGPRERLELVAQVVGDRHLLLVGGGGEVEVVEVEEPGQLGDRCGVVVHPQVDRDVVAAAVAGTLADDQQRGRLAPALVTARVVAGGQRGEQPVRQRQVGGGRLPGGDHRQHDVLAGQAVALDRVALAGLAAGPVDAGAPGVGGRTALDVDDADLAVVAALVLLEQPQQRDRRGRPGVEVGERQSLVGDVGVGLGGDGTHAGHGGRHGGPDGQELRGHGHPPGLSVGGPGHDRERHARDLSAVATRPSARPSPGRARSRGRSSRRRPRRAGRCGRGRARRSRRAPAPRCR